jgi:ribonuclease HI
MTDTENDAATGGAPTARHGLHLFTDGCCEPKSGDGGWAFVAYRDGVEIASAFGGVRKSANNAMEAVAILHAATWINSQAKAEAAIIWSDSASAVTGCNRWRPIWKTNGWKKITANPNIRSRTIADPELWQAIDAELSRNDSLTIAWCKGHARIDGNERADELAENGRLSMHRET